MKLLKILSLCQLMLGIVNMFADISSGLFVLIGALLLFMITCTRNWCTSVFYIVLSLMDFTQCVMLVGNYLAKNGKIENGVGILLFFTMIKLPFYVITIYYCFLAYRELKALQMEAMSGSNSQAMQSFNRSWDEAPRRQDPPAPQPYSGPGYRLG
jgi:hypothetical protein